MGDRVEVDGYTAELDENLDFVYRNRGGRQLKKVPKPLVGHQGLDRLRDVQRQLRRHGEEVPPQARQWSNAGVPVPEALADADAVWRRSLKRAGTPLVPGPTRGGLSARTYSHPDSHRGVTHVVDERLAPCRDLVMARRGWVMTEAFETGIPEGGHAPSYPERIMAAHPGREEAVLDIAQALDDATWEWRLLPKKALDAVFKQLDPSTPATLTVAFLDEVADRCLAAKETEYAKAYFGRARETERKAGLKTDQEWLEARYAAYADAKALSATTVRARARELSIKGAATAQQARAFLDLLARRLKAGADVYARQAADVRKVAKAAGLDPEEELAELLGRTCAMSLSLYDDIFWTDALKGRALDLLLARRPEFVQAVVKLTPGGYGASEELWLSLLERTGAFAQLAGERPGMPTGEAARWLSRCLRALCVSTKGLPKVLYELTERLLPRLAADAIEVEFRYPQPRELCDVHIPLDLIDLLLERGIPVADPPASLGAHSSPLRTVHTGRRPELRHLLADPRFALQLRAVLRAELSMTRKFSHNSWYQPHEGKGWTEVPALFDNPLGREVAREWRDDELARLRSGLDLEGLTLMLGRFMHAGVVVDTYLKSADSAAQFATVDVTDLLLDELPEGADRAAAEGVMAATQARHVYRDSASPEAWALRKRVTDAFPHLQLSRDAAWAFQIAVNCRVGLPRVIAQLTPDRAADRRAEGAGDHL